MTSIDDLDHIKRLAQGYEGISLLVVRPINEDDLLEDGEEAKLLPGRMQGRDALKIRKVGLTPLGKSPPTTTMKTKRTSVAPEEKKTVVMRISSEERYNPVHWGAIVSKAHTSILDWARLLLPREDNKKLHDIFHYFGDDKLAEDGKTKHTTFWASWRVDEEMVSKLIDISGQRCSNDTVYFIEPIRWIHPAPPPCKCAYRDFKRLTDESWPDYADRVFAASGPLGVARGERALGPREARGDPTEERRRRSPIHI